MRNELEDVQSKLRLLRGRLAQLAHSFHTEDDLTQVDRIQGTSLASLIAHAIRDIERREIHKREGSILDWISLTVAVHIANDLLSSIRKHEADAMQGWTFRRPKNSTQRAYTFVFDLLLMIGRSMVQIEDEHPELERWFDSLRDKRQMSAAI